MTDFEKTLTPRQRQVFALMCEGHRYKTIADKLGVTTRAITHHVEKIDSKLKQAGLKWGRCVLDG